MVGGCEKPDIQSDDTIAFQSTRCQSHWQVESHCKEQILDLGTRMRGKKSSVGDEGSAVWEGR